MDRPNEDFFYTPRRLVCETCCGFFFFFKHSNVKQAWTATDRYKRNRYSSPPPPAPCKFFVVDVHFPLEFLSLER